jgi:DNA repair protein RecN (Recombination protein N)
MLGGAKITDSVLANASEMKELAQVQKSARLK